MGRGTVALLLLTSTTLLKRSTGFVSPSLRSAIQHQRQASTLRCSPPPPQHGLLSRREAVQRTAAATASLLLRAGSSSAEGTGNDSSTKDSSCSTCKNCDMPDELFASDSDQVGQDAGTACNVCDAQMDAKHPNKLHLHFGAGRLSLGLVVPGLAGGGTRFAILQRPSKDWGKIAEEAGGDVEGEDEFAQLRVKINGEDASKPLRIITTAEQLDAALDTASSAADDGDTPVPLLVLSDDKDIVKRLVQGASSYSCSLGGAVAKVVAPMINDNLEKEECEDCRPVLFACENDFGPVRDLRKEVSGRLHVVETMVDRVCVSRTIEAGRTSEVDTVTEKSAGRIVVLEPMKRKLVPFGGDTEVVVPCDADTAKALYEHKFQTVNGLHGVLGFMSLRDAGVTKDTFEETLEKGTLPLLKPPAASCGEGASSSDDDSGNCSSEELSAWNAARGAFVLAKFGVSTLGRAFNVGENEEEVFAELDRRAADINKRLASLDDDAPRVLEGDAERSMRQRLIPTRNFLAALDGDGGADSGSGGGGAAGGKAAPAAARYLAHSLHEQCGECAGKGDDGDWSTAIGVARKAVEGLCEYAAEITGASDDGGRSNSDGKKSGGAQPEKKKEPVGAR